MKVLDTVLLILDGLLLAALVAVAALGDGLPLPKGQDVLVIARSGGRATQPVIPSPVPEPAPAPGVTEGAPAPAPQPVVPDQPPPPPPPGHLEWGRVVDAVRRGKEHMSVARKAQDPAAKRTAYQDAKKAFQEALQAVDDYKVACPEPNARIDEQAANVRTFIFECNKNSPIDLH